MINRILSPSGMLDSSNFVGKFLKILAVTDITFYLSCDPNPPKNPYITSWGLEDDSKFASVEEFLKTLTDDRFNNMREDDFINYLWLTRHKNYDLWCGFVVEYEVDDND